MPYDSALRPFDPDVPSLKDHSRLKLAELVELTLFLLDLTRRDLALPLAGPGPDW